MSSRARTRSESAGKTIEDGIGLWVNSRGGIFLYRNDERVVINSSDGPQLLKLLKIWMDLKILRNKLRHPLAS
jgi:hypothetical protein